MDYNRNKEDKKMIGKSTAKYSSCSDENNYDDEFPGIGSSIELYPCDANPYYTNKEEIELKIKFKIPEYVVKECKESSKRPDGWYTGEAIIEFGCVIDEETINQIKSKLKQQHRKCIKWIPGEYLIPILNPSTNLNGEYWAIILKENSKLGKIKYRTSSPAISFYTD